MMVIGLILPVLINRQVQMDVLRAQRDLQLIRVAVQDFLEDTGVGPVRGFDGESKRLRRLCGPGRISPGSYFRMDAHQGWIEDHLVHNQPAGSHAAGYASWKGPYLDEIGSDPWGMAYIIVLYPMFLDDERDCVVVSGGPNGRMDSRYSSPLHVVPAGDDLVEVIFRKSAARSAPLY